jgi:hypothetical protein
MKGIVVYSFGRRSIEREPGPCNVRLGQAAMRIAAEEDEKTLLVAQWEVARYLESHGARVDHVVQERDDQYLDSDQVWREARDLFREYDINDVIPVAQPLLHQTKVAHLARKDGFEVTRRPIGHIGFDNCADNQQWWTKGPLRLLAYSLRRALTGTSGT